MSEHNPQAPRKCRIAIVGARGLSNYGGFETFVGEIAPRLANLGYEVYVSSRSEDKSRGSWIVQGVHVLYFPFRFPRSNRLGRLFEVLYDSYFVLKCLIFPRCRLIYCLGIAAGPVLPVARLLQSVIVLNLDGLEWRRPKFQLAERLYIRFAFLMSYVFATHLVLDNRRLSDYVPDVATARISVIPYGVAPLECVAPDREPFREYADGQAANLEQGRYWLVVARLEPDNSIDVIVEAYSRSSSSIPLVIVGSFSSAKYAARIEDQVRLMVPGKRVVMVGSVYDRTHLLRLRCNCFAYIHGHSVGGTNPSLLEAMAVGNIIIAHDNPFNREVCGENALYFGSADSLASEMTRVERDGIKLSYLGRGAKAKAIESYGWAGVVEEYDRLFRRFC